MNDLHFNIELPDNLKLCGTIDRGGAGRIFRVKDITGKMLALKIVNSRWQDKELAALTILRDLPCHQSLVQIFQVGTLPDGRIFYTMELADNQSGKPESEYIPDTLANRINAGGMPFEQIIEIFIEIAKGASHLHKYGLAHGDIKPENIVFINSIPKLADFGTLAAKGDSGTAGFMVDDPVSAADRDCYALAKSLYCTWSRLDVSEYPSLPEKFVPKEARLIRSVYHKGCSPLAIRRFSSGEEFIAALEKIEERFHKYPKRKIIALICFFCLAAIVSVALILHGKPEKFPVVKSGIDQAEISLMNNSLRAGGELPDDLDGIRPFRHIFESLNEKELAGLDAAKVQWFKSFYNDLDHFKRLHAEIIAEKDLSKQLFLYKTKGYKKSFISLNSRCRDFDHLFVHQILILPGKL